MTHYSNHKLLQYRDRVLVQGEIKNWSNENAHGSLIVVQRLVMLNSKAKEAEIGPDGHQAPE